MLKKSLLVLALAASCGAVLAQSSPAKKELVARILKVQQPGIEALAQTLAEQPAAEMLERAGAALPARVPADKQEAVAKEIQADVRKYVQDTVPLVRSRAVQLAPSTVGALLEEKFTEDELKQVVAMMESPVYVKFQGLGGEMQQVLADKLVAETRPQVAPRLRNLEDSIAKRLGLPAHGGGNGGGAAAGKAPAKK